MALRLNNQFGFTATENKMLEEWQLQEYRYAATKVASQLNQEAHQMIDAGDGVWVPRWMLIAQEMHKLRLMVSNLREEGLL